MLRTLQDQTYVKISTHTVLHLPESPDSLYWIHSCMVPDEAVEILVFLLIFLFQKTWKTKDCNIWRQRIGGGREKQDNVPIKRWQFSFFLPIVAKMTDGDVYEMYNSKQICLDNQVKDALSFLTNIMQQSAKPKVHNTNWKCKKTNILFSPKSTNFLSPNEVLGFLSNLHR